MVSALPADWYPAVIQSINQSVTENEKKSLSLYKYTPIKTPTFLNDSVNSDHSYFMFKCKTLSACSFF